MPRSPELPRAQSQSDLFKEIRRPRSLTDDGWVSVGAQVIGSDEIRPNFQNSWTNVGGNAAPCSFYLDEFGVVHLRGAVVGGAPPSVVFTLPEGYRPEYTQRFVGVLSAGTDIATVQVDPDGKVWILGVGWNPGVGTITVDNLAPGSNGQVLGVVGGVATWIAAPGSTPGSTVISETSFGQSAAAGSNTTYSRSDHTHGTPTDPMPAHIAASDPHAQYQKESEKGAASGYAGLNSSALVPQGNLGSGVRDGTKFLRDDGVWVLPASLVGSSPGDTVVSETSFGQSSTAGTSADYSRKDHTHGTPTDPIPAHVADGDPHTQYQKESEKNAANGYAGLDTNTVVLPQYLGTGTRDGTKFLRDDGTWQTVSGGGGGGGTPGDTVVSETSFGQAAAAGTNNAYSRSDHTHGTPASPIPAHVADADPHTQYQKESEKGAANGYPALDSLGFVPVGNLGSGSVTPGEKFLRDDNTWQTINTGANRWYDGAGAPSGALGANDDYYINTTNGDIYQKISGAWVLQGNIAGSQGPTGPTGPIAPRNLMATWIGVMPDQVGPWFVWRVPFADGESKTFNLTRLFARMETPAGSNVQFRVDKSPGGGAFSPTTLDSVTISSGSYENENTTVEETVVSGNLLRLYFVTIDGSTAQFSVELLGEEV